MATIALQDVAADFPVGTLVGAHTRDQWGGNVVSGPPKGTPTDSALVDAAGALTFDGLSENTMYVAYALVEGEHRTQSFYVTSGIAGGGGGKSQALQGGFSGQTSPTPGTSTIAIPESDGRAKFTLSNLDDVEILWYSESDSAAVGEGHPVYPGETDVNTDYSGDVAVASPRANHLYSGTET